ncbi:uncharacterized protein [Eurosta solidaginis]|uniref:uncharacterized protein n=1 Tax=Eurosta solidaginis TaxID=178769 RepID=UPI00353141F0
MNYLAYTAALAVCFLGAYAIPDPTITRASETHKIDGMHILATKIGHTMVNTSALTPVGSACGEKFNNSTRKINNILIKQTNICVENANRTMTINNRLADKTVFDIRNNLQMVQNALGNCLLVKDVSKFLNCTTNSFDSYIELLDSTNLQVYQAVTEIASNQSQVDGIYRACISQAIFNAKSDFTQIANEYKNCLGNISISFAVTNKMSFLLN